MDWEVGRHALATALGRDADRLRSTPGGRKDRGLLSDTEDDDDDAGAWERASGTTSSVSTPSTVRSLTWDAPPRSLSSVSDWTGEFTATFDVAARRDDTQETRSLTTGELERLLQQSEYRGMLATQLGAASLVQHTPAAPAGNIGDGVPCGSERLSNSSSAVTGESIMAFKPKASRLDGSSSSSSSSSSSAVLYSQNRLGEACRRKPLRHIPSAPERILDAPDMVDDYYLNLLDWSSFNVLAVALGQAVYLWNASTGGIELLVDLADTASDDLITSVRWVHEGAYLALGTHSCQVQLWDAAAGRRLRSMRSHTGRVGALAWNGPLLSSGSRDATIHQHDVRQAQHHVATLQAHQQEVCGLQWSANGMQLASGANDNLLNIWDAARWQRPRFSLDHHTAAVKALAWCPWQSHLLASGGGTADRMLRIWNSNTGACLHAIDTHSQVCAVQWSRHHRELVTSHGFSQHQLIVWKYPSLTKLTELTGHTARVLHLATSPDGQTVVSGAADETLRFWKVFPPPAQAQRPPTTGCRPGIRNTRLRHALATASHPAATPGTTTSTTTTTTAGDIRATPLFEVSTTTTTTTPAATPAASTQQHARNLSVYEAAGSVSMNTVANHSLLSTASHLATTTTTTSSQRALHGVHIR
ncbi:hypothetical protein CDCA_CDCA18G4484 [Cyanidium caldarium]|uniref:CDC20/Fizzy WD40 domain-containing protein n=1 Tax=Cyanidium caldarium TaxID=2771 RepID=A0AAV9J2B1_CYACA|nr:hypothetical protein CDCA_CDCA18G4484 [Cyanidium caldarium]